MPASGCPSFTSIARNDNGFVFGTAVTGSPYGTGAQMNAGSGTAYVSTSSTTTVGDQLGRIDIAVAPSNPNVIYAQGQGIAPQNNSGGSAGCGNANGCQLGAWASTDGGATWSFMAGSAGGSLKTCNTTGPGTNASLAGDYPQNWYDQGIAVDPNNPDRIFVDTFEVWLANAHRDDLVRHDLRLLGPEPEAGPRRPARARVRARLVEHAAGRQRRRRPRHRERRRRRR